MAAALACSGVAAALACGSDHAGWERSTPESEGMSSEAFERWARAVEDRGTRALLVLRNGRLVHEWHASWRGDAVRHHAASIAKGIAGGLTLALLAEEGRVELDTPATTYVPRWRDDPARSQITVRQLASHSSGLANAVRDDPTEWMALFWRLDPERTPIQIALRDTPVVFPPGRGFAYSNTGFAVLSLVLAGALRDSDEPSLPVFLRERVFRPIGVADDEWSIGYGRPFDVEGVEAWATWGGARISARALARLGLLLLRRGDWDGHQVIPSRALETMIEDAGTPADPEGTWPAPALGWWTNARGVWSRLPRDTFLAFGRTHKVLVVVPSLDLVVVRLGESLDPDRPDDFWRPLQSLLLDPLMDAFEPPPVPRSETLAGAWFDPPSSLRCAAEDSDNWPVTTLPDGSLFTAYGDGFGFEPRTERKLSLGFARIRGDSTAFVGANTRSASGERTGDGKRGAKASGLLAVDGVLYMWARNLDNSQLAWSEDGGVTWEWGFRFGESFGSPTFLNFGPGYAGARDDFVYVYSQDGPSAYEADDRVVLARVPKPRIRERDAYEFFAGMDASGHPRWSRDLRERAGTLEYPGSCRRSEVIFDAGLGRYLMALGFDAHGGFGLFEAPEPWGPWRTVYSTRRWDLGDTHSYRLPTAWIRDGGRSLSVVVSGTNRKGRVLDGFCVRGLRILPLRTGSLDPESELPAVAEPRKINAAAPGLQR